jgi:hypothetical protein
VMVPVVVGVVPGLCVGDFGDGGAGGCFVDDGFAGGVDGDEGLDGEAVDGARVAAGGVDQGGGVVADQGIGPARRRIAYTVTSNAFIAASVTNQAGKRARSPWRASPAKPQARWRVYRLPAAGCSRAEPESGPACRPGPARYLQRSSRAPGRAMPAGPATPAGDHRARFPGESPASGALCGQASRLA